MNRSILDLLASEVRGKMRQSALLSIIKDARKTLNLTNNQVRHLVKKYSATSNAGAGSGRALQK